MSGLMLPEGYDSFLKSLKERVRAAQLRASLSVNRELVFCIGASAATSWPARKTRVGEPRSLTGSLGTCIGVSGNEGTSRHES